MSTSERSRFYESRQVLALPAFITGAILFCVCAGFLILADKISGRNLSKYLLS